MYSRRGAGSAERFTGIRRSDFSREYRQFATKVAPTDKKPLRSLRLCEKQNSKIPNQDRIPAANQTAKLYFHLSGNQTLYPGRPVLKGADQASRKESEARQNFYRP